MAEPSPSPSPSPSVARLFQRVLAVIFLIAWWSLGSQVLVLIGRRGLLPAGEFLNAARAGGGTLWQFPTVFWLGASDGALAAGVIAGALLAAAALVLDGSRQRAAFALTTALYLSYAVVGQSFLSFQWDNLLLECGACAVFLRRDRRVPWAYLLFRLILFKLYFESGIAKWQSHLGDWQDGSAMTLYYETAPLPTWLASYAHALPSGWHHFESWATLVLELVVPFAFFAPRVVRLPVAVLLTAFQLINEATANYGFFVWLALALHLFLLDDADVARALGWLRARVPRLGARPERAAPIGLPPSPAAGVVVLSLFGAMSLVDGLSAFVDLGPRLRQIAAALHPLWGPSRLVNTYHLFGHITTERIEPQLEISDGKTWTEYDLRYKAGDPSRAPRFVAPHQPRVDFQLWFYGLSYRHGMPRYVATLLERLCHEPAAVAPLFARAPPDAPEAVRLVFYRYRFSRATGTWWTREPVDVTEALHCKIMGEESDLAAVGCGMKNSYMALALAAVAGCGDPGTAQVDSFIQSLAQQKCDWEFRCCQDAEIQQMDGRKFSPTDEGSCVPYRILELEDQLFIDRLAVKEGRLRVDTDQASACVNQMAAQACNLAPGQTPPMVDPLMMDQCAHVFVGNTPAGSECIYSNECVDGAHCVSDQLAVGRGVCVPYEHEGEICNASTDCDPKVEQLYCAPQDYKCHVRARLDEACAFTTDSSGKNPTLPLLIECDNRLGNVYCDPTSNTCRQLPSDGEPCLSPPPPGVGSSCDPDPALQLVCDTSGGTGSGTCRAPGGLGADCSQRGCAKDFYCASPSYTCATLPTLGQQCQVSGYVCAKPYFCNTSQSPYVCDQPAMLGESCVGRSCDTNLYCDPSETCAARMPDGAQCTSSVQCLSAQCGFPSTGGSIEYCKPSTVGIQCIGR